MKNLPAAISGSFGRLYHSFVRRHRLWPTAVSDGTRSRGPAGRWKM